MLKVDNLNQYYGGSHILRNLSFEAKIGEVTTLLGRNGVGKTTLLKSLMGLVKVKTGSISFDGKDITHAPSYERVKAGIGYVPEERWIFPTLTVVENLAMGIKGGKIDKKNTNAWTAEKIFERFPSLEKRQKSKGANLSGGEQQMLAVGRSLMGNPDLILVDEPTEGLAPLLRKEVRDMLESISKTGVSILLVEHNFKVAMSLASRVYVMKKACCAFAGTVEELAARDDIREKYLEV